MHIDGIRAVSSGQARQQLVDNVASLKRSHDAAIHLAQLLPAGGRAAKLRRAVSHLGEVLVIGAWLAEQSRGVCRLLREGEP